MVSRPCLAVNYPDSIRHVFWVSNSSTAWLVNPKPWKILGPWASEPPHKKDPSNPRKYHQNVGFRRSKTRTCRGLFWGGLKLRGLHELQYYYEGVTLATGSPLLPRLAGKCEFQGTIALQPLQIVPDKSLEIRGFVHETCRFIQNQIFDSQSAKWLPKKVGNQTSELSKSFCDSFKRFVPWYLVFPVESW